MLFPTSTPSVFAEFYYSGTACLEDGIAEGPVGVFDGLVKFLLHRIGGLEDPGIITGIVHRILLLIQLEGFIIYLGLVHKSHVLSRTQNSSHSGLDNIGARFSPIVNLYRREMGFPCPVHFSPR